MKKTFIFTVLISLSTISLAQDKLQLKSYIECGYYDGNLSWFQSEKTRIRTPETMSEEAGEFTISRKFSGIGTILENRAYTDINFSADWKNFKFNTNFLTIIAPEKINVYQPLQTEYTIGLSYQWKMILLNAEHMCTHSTEKYIY